MCVQQPLYTLLRWLFLPASCVSCSKKMATLPATSCGSCWRFPAHCCVIVMPQPHPIPPLQGVSFGVEFALQTASVIFLWSESACLFPTQPSWIFSLLKFLMVLSWTCVLLMKCDGTMYHRIEQKIYAQYVHLLFLAMQQFTCNIHSDLWAQNASGPDAWEFRGIQPIIRQICYVYHQRIRVMT